MNHRRRAPSIVCRVAGIVALLAIMAMLAGCGGGFSGDSRNAGEIGDAIFGPSSDTTDSR